MSEYVVELQNVTKIFPGVKALSNMELHIKPGEIHGLILKFHHLWACSHFSILSLFSNRKSMSSYAFIRQYFL